MNRENKRIKITEFLQWNDSNGWYTDKRCDLEESKRMAYEEAVKYFFGVLNEEFYYKKVDNIFELTYEDTIRDAKENGFYNETYAKLKVLVENESPTEKLYKSLI